MAPASPCVFGTRTVGVHGRVAPAGRWGVTEAADAGGDQHDARADLIGRLAALERKVPLTLSHRMAFSDVIGAYELPGFGLRLDPRKSFASPEHGGIIRVDGKILFDDEPVGSIRRTLFPQARMAHHGLLELEAEFRDAGVAVGLNVQAFDLYDGVGIHTVRLLAALGTGPWYWARCGFDFHTPDERAKVEEWVRIALHAIDRDDIDIAKFTHASQFALMGTTPEACCCMNDLREALLEAYPVPEGEKADVVRHLEECAAENGFDMDRPLPLGRLVMLLAPPWQGKLRLDGEDRLIFDAYANSRLRLTGDHEPRL